MIKKEKIKKILTNKIFIISFVIILLSIIIYIIYRCNNKKNIESNTDNNIESKENVIMAMSADIHGFDPCKVENTSTTYGDIYFNIVHDKLLILDENKNLKPQLLKELPQKEGKILKCELKDNIFFHNNEKMTTDDVIFTIQKGKQQQHEQFLKIDNIEKIDNLKFKITLKEDVPYYAFPFTQIIRIINQKATEQNESEGVKIGAGAYKLTNYIPNQELQLELFDKYHDQNIIKNSPKTIKLKIFKDDNTIFLSLTTGEIDAILSYPGDEIKQLKTELNMYPNIKILENEPAVQSYIYFNKQKIKENVRKIIAKSLDIQNIINELGLPDTIAKSALHNRLIGHNPSINYHQHDIESAKKEVQKLSPEDKKLKIACGKGKRKPIIDKIIEQLKNVGFDTNLEEPDFGTMRMEARQGKNSPYNFIFIGEGFEMEYAHKYIEDYFKTTNNKSNYFGIDENDKIHIEDKLTKATKSSTELTEYTSLLQEIEQYLYEKKYLFPLIKTKTFILVNNKIEKGFEQDAFGRFFNMRSIKYPKK